MAAKRYREDDYDSGDDFDQPPQQRRTMKNIPTFASVIREAVAMKFFDNFCTALEPMLRKVVNEEVENGIKRSRPLTITRSPSLRIEAPQPTSLQLTFTKKLSLPIFTGTKILDIENNPLQVFLVETNGDGKVPVALPFPIKIEIVVLDGDFDSDREWKSNEFSGNVVKERTGRRPLLTGDFNVVMREGYACVGDIEFTDNSSWIRSRKFRVGARVVASQPGWPEIKGAMTESFVVRDHRGELYKKHHPPALQDEVWRLEKIGKGGAFDRKLSSAGIKTVQEFLKLSVVDQSQLRRVLGSGMSDKLWKVTIRHARTCVLGEKLYVLHGNGYNITLNPICQVVKAEINGHTRPIRELMNMNKGYIENLVKDAYSNWNSLEQINGLVNETPLLTQGDLVDQHTIQQQNCQEMARIWPYQQPAMLTDGSYEVNSLCVDNGSNDQGGRGGYSDWIANTGYICSSVNSGVFQISESSSDGGFC